MKNTADSPEPNVELLSLIAAVCEGTMTPEHWTQLNKLLAEDADARAHYIQFLDEYAELLWRYRKDENTSINPAFAELETGMAGWNGNGADGGLLGETSTLEIAPPRLAPTLSGHFVSLFSPDTALGGFVISYGASTVVLAIVLLIFAMMASPSHRGEPMLVQQDPPKNAPRSRPTPKPEREIISVAGITGTVDCVWEKPDEAPALDRIKLHDKLALKSGLVEITYDTGARVILEGPCRYEVESPAGGFLQVGKVVARVEKKAAKNKGTGGAGRGTGEGVASGEWRVANGDRAAHEVSGFDAVASGERRVASEAPAPRPASPAPVFVVRTPAVTVTDLGTEFGVEVSDNGSTYSHVFRGKVVVKSCAEEGKSSEHILGENESIHFERNDAGKMVLSHSSKKTPSFVQRMPQQRVLAYFRLGEDDAGAVVGKLAGEETIDRVTGRRLQRNGSPRWISDTGAPGSTLAMQFNRTSDYFEGSRQYSLAVENNFIFEAWARLDRDGGAPLQVIAYDGCTSSSGFGLLHRQGHWQVMYGGVTYLDSGVAPLLHQWTHIAVVCENHVSQIWINGKPAGSAYAEWCPYMGDGTFKIGGTAQDEIFEGAIDEVRLSIFTPPFDASMFLLPRAERGKETNKLIRSPERRSSDPGEMVRTLVGFLFKVEPIGEITMNRSTKNVMLCVCAAALVALSAANLAAGTISSFTDNLQAANTSHFTANGTGTLAYGSTGVTFPAVSGDDDRTYLATVGTGLYSNNFTAEVSYVAGSGKLFFGIGTGTPNASGYSEPTVSPSAYVKMNEAVATSMYTCQVPVTGSSNGAGFYFANKAAIMTAGGTERLQVVWDSAAKSAHFFLDVDYNGTFAADYTISNGSITAGAGGAGWDLSGLGLSDGNLHVFFGSGDSTDSTGVTCKNFSLQTVPEPTTGAMVLCGLLGLIAYAWRKRK